MPFHHFESDENARFFLPETVGTHVWFVDLAGALVRLAV